MTKKPKKDKLILMAGPWGPKGGGMYKVMDYLMQAQNTYPCNAELRAMDTRGNRGPLFSAAILTTAIFKLIGAHISGRLLGIHINMAERLSVGRKGLLIVVAKLLGVPIVLHLHAAQFDSFYAKLGPGRQKLVRWIFSLPQAIIVLGHKARTFVISELGVGPERVEILINGVPGPAARPPARSADSELHVVFLGNLSERKGVSDFLEALATLGFACRKWRATLAGGGDVAYYEAKAAKLGISSLVRFPGWMNQEQSSNLLATADMLVLPSYDEGLPLVILEALSHGVPVICTPVGEIPQVLTHGENACFVDVGNVESLASSIEALMGNDVQRQNLSAAGRDVYERCFSLKVFFSNVLGIYHRHFGLPALLNSGGGTSPATK